MYCARTRTQEWRHFDLWSNRIDWVDRIDIPLRGTSLFRSAAERLSIKRSNVSSIHQNLAYFLSSFLVNQSESFSRLPHRLEWPLLNGISLKPMRLLTTPFILTIMNLFFSTALIPRSTMFYTLGSKSSMFRISSITTEVPYARKLIRHQWTLTQKLAALGSDIWVLQFDGGSRGDLLANLYGYSN